MRKSLMNKTTLKILSLLIAVLTWLMVLNIQDPVRQYTFRDIPVTIVNDSYLTSEFQIPLLVEGKDTVNVRIQAATSVLKDLDKADIKAEADMTQIISMNTDPYMVPVRVTCEGVAEEDITVSPANIPIETDKLTSEEMTISTSTGQTVPDSGYEVGKMTVNPEKVTVSGPAELINKIDRVVATVDVSGMNQSGSVQAGLHIYDKNGDELSDKQMSYLELREISDQTVSVNVDLWKVRQDIAIEAEYSGTPAYGYEVSGVSTVPDSISLAGTEEALERLAENGNTLTISGSYIDVSEKSADFEQTVDITDMLPDNVKLVRDTTSSVVVTVKILPYNSKEYDIPATSIDKTSKPEDMTVVISDESVTVRVKGNKEALDGLKEDDIKLKIDTKSYTEEGEYQVPVSVTLPSGCELVDKVTVKVKLVQSAEKQPGQ